MRIRPVNVVLFLAIIIAVFYSPLTSYLLKDFIISRIEKAIDMRVVFEKTEFEFPARLAVSKLKAIDKNGAALTARRAHIRLDPSKIIKANLTATCDLQDVSLGSSLGNSLNGLLRPLGAPAQNSYKFDNITAAITIKKNSLEVHGLNATGPDFRLMGEFTRFKDKKVDYNMEVRINKQVLGAEDFKKNRLLTNEDPQGWYIVKLSVKGDPRKPSSVSFSTGGIRLEIQSVDGKK